MNRTFLLALCRYLYFFNILEGTFEVHIKTAEQGVTMKRNRIFIVVVVALMLLTVGNAMADELWLKNGDHITGKVIRMENKILVFKTSYAGDVSIKWGEIANIRTDKPIQMVLSNEVSTHGIATPA